MGKLDPVLVMECVDGVNILKTEYISNENIPETLNGESGFHIYHVRMLTELILRQLLKNNNDFGYTEDEIISISVASSLHDIGKAKIPKSILNFPGKLSPVEYDIVKKHAVLGEKIIDEIQSDIDSKTIKYAKEIARSHHERYDGTGYPDALKGNEIPISAQVVSLADAFDALTSARSYKKAFSQDVAIEMISNGMCGVFNSELIECLLQVVNNKVLVDLREQLKKARSVVSGQNVFEPKRVLFVGNTGYVTKEFIDETFYESKVMIIGNSRLKSDTRIKVYNLENPNFKSTFETYDFDIIIYLANELSFNSSQKSDAEDLREILNCVKDLQKDARFLYLSSLDAAFEDKTDRALLASSKESLCEYYGDKFSVDVKIVRIPYLYLSTNEYDFLHSVFEQAESGSTIRIDETAAARSYFLSMYDLSDFIVRFVDNWKPGIGILNINDEFNISFSDFEEKFKKIKNGVKFEFTGKNSIRVLNTNNKAVRNEYGWFSKISILEDLEEQYEKYLQSVNLHTTSVFDKIKLWIQKHSLISKIIELFALFIITEFLVRITDSAAFFSIVDFRMAFIVIMATIHGLAFGIAAAGLSSISWLVAKIGSGTKWLTIFYETSNWLAFVFFFLVGALCGYVRLKSDDKITYLQEQNKLLEEKLVFTRELYSDTFNEKRILKKQIIGSKDSFGKIFDITRQLDTVEPKKLYLKIMDTFEDILENKSISVYSVNENSAFGRLEVASRDIINNAARSISLDSYEHIIDTLNGNEIWRNTELASGYPMYAAGVYRSGKLELLIFIWHSGPEQRSLYYVNLFKILCDLVQMSLLRAYDYNQAIYEQQYISGTNILNAEAFKNTAENFKQMAERKVFSYVQLEIDCKNYSYIEIQEMLSKRIRTNDILGVTGDGKLRLLLSQATNKDLEFILPRFEGLDVTVLKNND